MAEGKSGAECGMVSGRGVGYPRVRVGELVRAKVMETGFGRMVGRRGDEFATPVMMLGS